MKSGEIKKICSIGTGTIGPGIALAFAMGGFQVHMCGRSEEGVQRGLQAIDNMLVTFCDYGVVEQSKISSIKARIKGVNDLAEAVEGTGFVIESIVEDLAIKQTLFLKLEEICPANTVFASSTSGLLPTSISEPLRHRDRFIVAHFWNPPQLIPLVEVVPGQDTSQDTIAKTLDLLGQIGKQAVLIQREALGFIGNRLQFAMLREALALIDSGVATKEAVDATIKYALGRRLAVTGPFESADLSGLDTIHNVSSYLVDDLCSSKEVSPTLRELVNQGKLGAKTGSGFYDWTPESLKRLQEARQANLIDWFKKDRTDLGD